MERKIIYQKDGYILRLTQKEDAMEYYKNNSAEVYGKVIGAFASAGNGGDTDDKQKNV